jgi:hydrophobic/amphiphilic exporter-1 (mainly G- bacteria), HAE1 family
VRTYNSIAGFNFFTGSAAGYVGTGFIGLQPWKDRDRPDLTATAIIRKINVAFSKIPEARAFCIAPPAIPGLSAAGGFSIFLQDRSGGSVEFLARNVKAFVDEARKRPELANVTPNFSPSVPQLFADVDKERLMKQGVPIADVYGTLQAFLGGAYVNDFTRFGRQWKVFLQAEPEDRNEPDDVKGFYVRNAHGDMVPLSTFVRMRTTTGPEYTVRFNLYRSAEVIGAPAAGYSSGQAIAALEDVAAKTLPPEMAYAWNALSYQEKLAQGGTAKVLGLSLVFVFLILAALYESWSLPFSVLLSTPVAVLGAYLGLLSRHFDNNVYAQIGLVMLVGLTAKNAILIVEFAKGLREQGKGVVEAALEGARLRLRPILMTSFAFIFGVVPLAIATGAGSEMRQSLGTAVFFGMLGVTGFGLIFTPVFYVMVRGWSQGLREQAHTPKHPPETYT